MKVGLIGGTFNPVHLGHLRGAEETREMLDLDEIVFIPALIPPHKNSQNIASADHRLKMLKLATDSNPAFKVSDIEIKREGPSYTIDTLKYFNSTYHDNEYFFITGTELFTRIDTWKDYKKLFDFANFIILNRPGYYDVDPINLFPITIMNDFILHEKSSEICKFIHTSTNKVIYINIEGIKLSSTKIRELIAENKSISYLVPEKIRDYISRNNLYREETK